MHKDYLVVGFGLAGLAFTSILERNSKSFFVIDNNIDASYRVIGGMYNPIILKRFTPAWRAHEMWLKSLETYQYFSKRYQTDFIQPFQINRILQSVEEQNNWTVASDKVIMKEYMQPEICHQTIEGIYAPFGFGVLEHVGRVEGERILQTYKSELIENGLLSNETFQYEDIIFHDEYVEYHGNTFSRIVFSEGYQIQNNPFFNYLPMKVSKGEMLVVHVPDLKMQQSIKSSCFMVPVGNQMYIVGATYNWDDKGFELTENGKEELEEKLQSFLKIPYTILDYKTGIRPTVSDRRPLVGRHPKHKKLCLLNGLGTRGIIYAPALAEILFNHLEKGEEVDKEMNINRFEEMFLN